MKYKFMRLKPEIHNKIKLEATKEGKSINKFLDDRFKENFEVSPKTKKNEKVKYVFKW